MIKKLFLFKKIFFFLQIVVLVGCSVHSPHDRSYVSDSIYNRTGHPLRLTNAEGVFKLPENASLDDGLAEDEAVAIALWNNAQFQAGLVALGFARADLIEAGLLRNPVLSLLFSIGPKQLEAALSLPIEFFWQRPKRVAAAKLTVEQVADNLIQHGLNFIRDVRLAYTELILARERAKIVVEEAVLLNEIAAIASVRLRVGDINKLEETAFHLEAARTQESSIRLARDAKLAEERLPILNWNKGKISRAQAELEQAARQYMVVKHRIAREVLEAYTNYLAAQQALKILQVDIIPAAKKATKNAEEAYSVSETSYLELLDFKRQLLDSRLREAEADMRRAEANLKHSIGFKPTKNEFKSVSN